jgi:DNA polymerase I-like protein with 3'-5' exonuclease and polymerase domains
MNIALIDKQPSKTNYKQYLKFDFDHYHLSSVRVEKLLKKDVDTDFDPTGYDFVILVGSEALKYYTGKTAIGEKAGHIIEEKYIPIMNPAILAFKPEAKAPFEEAIKKLHRNISGDLVVKTHGEFVGIQDEEEALAYLTKIRESGEATVSLDTETSGLYARNCNVLGISISNGIREGAYISSDAMSDYNTELLQDIINNKTIVFHNAKFDMQMLSYHFGLKFDPKHTHDTLVMHYMLDETVGSHGLKELALKYTDYGEYDKDLDDFKKDYCKRNHILEADFTYDVIPFEIMYKYAACDTAVTFELYKLFRKYLYADSSSQIRGAYENIMIPGIFFLAEMEGNGIPFDKERLEYADRILTDDLTNAKQYLYGLKEVQEFQRLQGAEFNPNSPTQLRKLLFDYIGLKSPGKKTGTGQLSTDAEVLEELESSHPVVKHLMTIRQLSKIKNTYIDALKGVIDMDGRIRTNFNLTSTTSGRLSSSGKFNAQQLPRDNPVVKGSIKAPPGYKIVSQDLVTAEMYVAAVLSGDKNLQDVFITGKDFHSSIAKKVFKLDCLVEDLKKLYKIERQAAKAISFGILYGSGPEKVATTVNKEGGNFSIEEAVNTIDEYFETFPKLRKWLNNCQSYIKEHAYIYSALGRKRRLKNVSSPDKGIAGHEVRSGINFLVQSVASDINLLAAIDMNNILKTSAKVLDAQIIMLVHDSIVAVVKEEDVEEFCKLLKMCTQKDRGVSIKNCPIGVDQEIGDDYSFGKWEEKHAENFKQYQISCLSNSEAGDNKV